MPTITPTGGVHYGKQMCPKCGTFLGFAGKPENEGKRRETSRFDVDEVAGRYGMLETFCVMCNRLETDLPPREVIVIDHVKPLEDGGVDCLENLQLLCTPCHFLKHWLVDYLNKHPKLKDEKDKKLFSEAMG